MPSALVAQQPRLEKPNPDTEQLWLNEGVGREMVEGEAAVAAVQAAQEAALAEGKAPRPIPTDTGIYKLLLHAKSTLGTLGLRESVALPPGNDRNEWVTSQILGLYEELHVVVAAVGSFCECREMDAGLRTRDGKKLLCKWTEGSGSTAEDCTAREYMGKVLAYVHEQLSNRDVFPIDGSAFPEQSAAAAKQMLKRMFRVYAHVYLFHFERVQKEKMEAHLNFCYKHFLYFVREFDLLGDQDMVPLRALNERWLATPSAGPEDVPADLRDPAQTPAPAEPRG